MIKYAQLVDYIKRNHVNWNTDLFDVLRGFFEEYSQPHSPSPSPSPTPPVQQAPIDPYNYTKDFMRRTTGKFREPEDGEYTTEDLLNLFST